MRVKHIREEAFCRYKKDCSDTAVLYKRASMRVVPRIMKNIRPGIRKCVPGFFLLYRKFRVLETQKKNRSLPNIC